jgi:hypothetical protein
MAGRGRCIAEGRKVHGQEAGEAKLGGETIKPRPCYTGRSSRSINSLELVSGSHCFESFYYHLCPIRPLVPFQSTLYCATPLGRPRLSHSAFQPACFGYLPEELSYITLEACRATIKSPYTITVLISFDTMLQLTSRI